MISGWLYLMFSVMFGIAALVLSERPGYELTFRMCSLFSVTDLILSMLYFNGVWGT